METNLVYANGAVALTNSILVAEKFEKDHQHILRDIRNLMEGVSRIGDAPMFEETTSKSLNRQNCSDSSSRSTALPKNRYFSPKTWRRGLNTLTHQRWCNALMKMKS